MQQVLFYINQGGLASWILVLFALMLLVVSIERFYVLFVAFSFDNRIVLKKIQELVQNRKYSLALQACHGERNNPELAIVRAGLVASESGREAMKSALASAIVKTSSTCESRLPLVALASSGATLLGLLGTISGLIKTFAGMASVDASAKSHALGAGISEAMYSTGAGLMVALVAMVVHTIFTSKADAIISKCKSTGLEVISWVERAERMRQDVG